MFISVSDSKSPQEITTFIFPCHIELHENLNVTMNIRNFPQAKPLAQVREPTKGIHKVWWLYNLCKCHINRHIGICYCIESIETSSYIYESDWKVTCTVGDESWKWNELIGVKFGLTVSSNCFFFYLVFYLYIHRVTDYYVM